MEIDEWSHDSNAFKTISSGSETRNQTTAKKQYSRSRRIKSSMKSMNNSSNIAPQNLERVLKWWQAEQQNQIAHRKYQELTRTANNIRMVRKQLQESDSGRRRELYEDQQYAIYQRHEQQMQHFRTVWDTIFQKFRRKEQVTVIKLLAEQQKELRQLFSQLQLKKIRIHQRYSKSKQLKQLHALQASLVQTGKFEILAKLNVTKRQNQMRSQLGHKLKKQIHDLQTRQLQKLRLKYARKQNSLKMKLNECREYESKVYKKHQQILKQKFLNSLSKLKHEQLASRKRSASACK